MAEGDKCDECGGPIMGDLHCNKCSHYQPQRAGVTQQEPAPPAH